MGVIGGSDDDFSCCENAQRFVYSLACVCRIHHLYERREYAFMVLWKYTIISRTWNMPVWSESGEEYVSFSNQLC